MIDYTQIKNSYAYGNPDAHLLLEQALCEAAGHCTNDRELGRIARHLAASMDAGKAERMEAQRRRRAKKKGMEENA